MKRKIQDLSPQELFALAIFIEQTNQKILREYAEAFDGYDEEVAKNFEEMSEEESRHEEFLRQKYGKMFKEPIPPLRNFDVDEVVGSVGLEGLGGHFGSYQANQILQMARLAEQKAKQFYVDASKTVKDHVLANIFHEFAEMEGDHAEWLELKLGLKKKP
ncbi:MAG TPA: ferritin family protein [bacterium]|nr:ferritin family protein [bacterium]